MDVQCDRRHEVVIIVDLLPLSTTDETVVLLSDKKVDEHIDIDLDVWQSTC